jgi:hypothetical protein
MLALLSSSFRMHILKSLIPYKVRRSNTYLEYPTSSNLSQRYATQFNRFCIPSQRPTLPYTVTSNTCLKQMVYG